MDISTLWKLAWALEAEAVQIELRGMDGSGKRREAVLAGEIAGMWERRGEQGTMTEALRSFGNKRRASTMLRGGSDDVRHHSNTRAASRRDLLHGLL